MSRFGGWPLFFVLTLLSSAVFVLIAFPTADFGSVEGLLSLVRQSVRSAIPWFWFAFVASSLAVLWPNKGTRWLLANRRYFGLAFALTFLWQALFLILLAVTQWPYFKQNMLDPIGFGLGVAGYVLLAVMSLTSFPLFSRMIGPVNWRRLHKFGMYVVWFFIVGSYISARPNRSLLLQYTLLVLFMGAWFLRIAAWSVKRRRRRAAHISQRAGATA